MRTIDPHLFTRLMCLPPHRRIDLLEFIGASPVADLQLELLIDMMSAAGVPDGRPARTDPSPPAGEPASHVTSVN